MTPELAADLVEMPVFEAKEASLNAVYRQMLTEFAVGLVAGTPSEALIKHLAHELLLRRNYKSLTCCEFDDSVGWQNMYQSKPLLPEQNDFLIHIFEHWKHSLIAKEYLTHHDLSSSDSALFLSLGFSEIILVVPFVVRGALRGACRVEFDTREPNNEEVFLLKIFARLVAFLMQQEEGIRSSQEELVKSASQPAFVVNSKMQFVDLNEVAAKIYGYRRDQLAGSPVGRFVFSNFPQFAQRSSEAGSVSERHFFDKTITSLGKIIPAFVSVRPVGQNGHTRYLIFVKDVRAQLNPEKEILRAIIEAEENERKRVAKDLHDGLGPLLSTIKLYVSEIESADLSRQKRQEIFAYTYELIDDAVSTTKSISNNLMPSVIRDYGLIAAIESFCKKVRMSDVVNVLFESQVSETRFEPTVEIVLYRIVKELINNTLKYARATQIQLSILQKGERLMLNYLDDGVGFDVQKMMNEGGGMGLNNIFSKARSINGHCEMNSEIGKGVHALITVNL